jgi:nicotinamide riboside transporter PnuC
LLPSSSVSLWYVVQRTKLCLDFTCTVFLFHIAACWVYNGFLANTLSWWVINVVSITLMCVTGEFLCMRTELKAIPVSMSASKVDL